MVSEQHILKHWPCPGGMGAVARRHQNPVGIVPQTGAGPWTPLGMIRRRLRDTVTDRPESLKLFYNGYGIEWGVNDTPGSRQWLYLHSDYPLLSRWIGRTLRHADGYLVVNPAIKRKLQREIPFLPENRIQVVPLPVKGADQPLTPPDPPRRELVIGFAGRVQFRQKRIERIPAFVEALRQSGRSFRLEIMGTGDAVPFLEKTFREDPDIHLLGHLEGEAYFARLRSWKYIFFPSDYEGLPLSLLEGLACGAVPVYPDFHDKKDWTASLGGELHYPHGEMEAAARVVETVESDWSESRWEDFFTCRNQLLGEHTEANYRAVFRNVAASAQSGPHRKQRFSSPYGSWMPLWLYHRIVSQLQFGSFAAPRLKRVAR